MSIFANGLVAAMEEETQAAELAIDSTGADSAEADIVEATDISADVEAGTAEIDQAAADADTLERIADTAEAAEADGGLDPVAAEITEIAVEAIYARLGVQRGSYPALESFSGRTGRRRATQVAVEDIKETIKKIWAAIVTAFQKLIDMITNFFGKLFDGNRKLLARINVMQKKVASARGETSGKIKAQPFFGPGAMTAGDLTATASDYEKAVGAIGEFTANLSSTVGQVSLAQGGSFLEKATDIQKVQAAAKKTKDILENSSVFKSIEIYYDSDIPVTQMVKYGAISAWETIKGMAVRVKELLPGTEVQEVDALSLADIRSVLNSSESIIKKNLEKKSQVEKFKADIKKAIEAAKKIADQAPSDDNGAAEESRVAQRAIQNAGNAAIKLFMAVNSSAVKIAKGGVDTAERSFATLRSGGSNVNTPEAPDNDSKSGGSKKGKA